MAVRADALREAAKLLLVTSLTLQSIVSIVFSFLRLFSFRLDGVRRISIDEKACRNSHPYITLITYHDSSPIIFAS